MGLPLYSESFTVYTHKRFDCQVSIMKLNQLANISSIDCKIFSVSHLSIWNKLIIDWKVWSFLLKRAPILYFQFGWSSLWLKLSLAVAAQNNLSLINKNEFLCLRHWNTCAVPLIQISTSLDWRVPFRHYRRMQSIWTVKISKIDSQSMTTQRTRHERAPV